MDIVLCGHSFVRRFRDWINPNWPKSDINVNSKQRAIELAHAMRLNDGFQYIYTVSDNIIFIRDLVNAVPYINTLCPQVSVIDIGSNDIALLANYDPASTLSLALNCMDIAKSLSCPAVVINAVLPRISNLACSADTFLKNANDYNRILSNMCESDHVGYNRLKGFHCNQTPKQVPKPKPVEEWSDDGIHCSHDSMNKYLVRVRHAVMTQRHKIM